MKIFYRDFNEIYYRDLSKEKFGFSEIKGIKIKSL